MWYLQFHFVCDKLFTSFIMMTSLCFFVQLADRTLILSKGSFSVYIIATRLLLNHSPSEWFTYTIKTRIGNKIPIRVHFCFQILEGHMPVPDFWPNIKAVNRRMEKTSSAP